MSGVGFIAPTTFQAEREEGEERAKVKVKGRAGFNHLRVSQKI